MIKSAVPDYIDLTSQDKLVVLGKIGAPYGVQGFNHVQSYTAPLDNLLSYENLLLGHRGRWCRASVKSGRLHGKGLVVKFTDIANRDEAQKLTGHEIAVLRDSLPTAKDEGYYWVDLEGLTVENLDGVVLGIVDYLYDIADNTNMLVKEGKKERHIPFVEPDFVHKVCFESKKIIVDWDPSL